jgi:hypothetical protein
MKKVSTESWIMALFVVLAVAYLGWLNISKPRILILHSYDPEYAWVRDVNVGLNRVLGNSFRYQLRWHYMDTKRHPSAAYKQAAGIAARNVIAEMQPDVVIALDDDAQSYAARYLVNRPGISIVFGGVNNEAADYGYDKAHNATGILERLPLAAIQEALGQAQGFKALKRPLRLAYLGDASHSVEGDIKQIRSFAWAPMVLQSTTQVSTWPEWQAQIRVLAQSADVLLLTGYRNLHRSAQDPRLVEPQEVVTWTDANAGVPVMSGNGFFTEDGGMLAVGTSPYEQGEEAARRALDIVVRGTPAAQMPIVEAQQFIVTMNATLMKAHGFALPRIYEAAARTGNKYIP